MQLDARVGANAHPLPWAYVSRDSLLDYFTGGERVTYAPTGSSLAQVRRVVVVFRDCESSFDALEIFHRVDRSLEG